MIYVEESHEISELAGRSGPADTPGALDMPLTSMARAIPRVARATPEEPVSGGDTVVSPLQRAKIRDIEYHFGSCFRAERVFFSARFILFYLLFFSLSQTTLSD